LCLPFGRVNSFDVWDAVFLAISSPSLFLSHRTVFCCVFVIVALFCFLLHFFFCIYTIFFFFFLSFDGEMLIRIWDQHLQHWLQKFVVIKLVVSLWNVNFFPDYSSTRCMVAIMFCYYVCWWYMSQLKFEVWVPISIVFFFFLAHFLLFVCIYFFVCFFCFCCFFLFLLWLFCLIFVYILVVFVFLGNGFDFFL